MATAAVELAERSLSAPPHPQIDLRAEVHAQSRKILNSSSKRLAESKKQRQQPFRQPRRWHHSPQLPQTQTGSTSAYQGHILHSLQLLPCPGRPNGEVEGDENAYGKSNSAGTAYKFRVAGIQRVDRGPWSEVSALKTCLSGSRVRHPPSKSANRQIERLSWEPPSTSTGDIIEFGQLWQSRAYDANGKATPNRTEFPLSAGLIRVYVGKPCHLRRAHCNLQAHIDTSTKPAIIIFRYSPPVTEGLQTRDPSQVAPGRTSPAMVAQRGGAAQQAKKGLRRNG